MATLDNAVWFGIDGFAESGTTTISEGGNSTTITGTFTNDAWDATSNGTNVSGFGSAFITAPITANYQFSNAVENLSFTFEHVSSSGTTYDDEFTLYIYDEDGVLIPAAEVIAGLTGVTNATVYANPDGSVVIEADNDVAENITVNITGREVSEIDITFDVGPDGTQTGGAGLSDFTFDVPVPPNYIVEGTAGNDTIDAFYLGDPEGDDIDNSDHSDGSNDDSVQAGAGDDSVVSGAGDDTVSAGTGNDTVEGGIGNDSISGFDGDDNLSGDAGSDTIFGADGSDTILGGDGDDDLDGDDAFATGAADSIDGGAGNDQIIGDVGNDTLIGGDGNDTVFAGDDDDLIRGGDGQDVLYGQSGNDSIDGGANEDTIIADQGDDVIYGGDGSDSISGGSGDDTIHGGGDSATSTGGTDSLSYTYSVFHLGTAPEADVVDGDSTMDDPDAFLGTYGGPGNELYNNIQTATTVDTDGNTRINNADTEGPAETVTINGVAHTIDVAQTLNATVTFDDGTTASVSLAVVQTTDGNLYVFPEPSNTADHAVLTSNPIVSISLDSVSQPYVTVSSERMDGNYALPGDTDTSADFIDAGAGNDVVDGGAGNDSIYSDDGNDIVNAGDGDDYVSAGSGNDNIDAGAGNDDIDAGAGEDTVEGGTGRDNIDGDAGNDSLSGGDGNDSIWGGDGNDTIDGGANDDALYGNAGDDSLIGGAGSDYLQATTGADTLSGGDDDDNLDIVAGAYADGTVVTVDGGTGGVDNDTLDLDSWDAYRNLVQNSDPDADSFSGNVEVRDASGNWITVNFTEIENFLLPTTDLSPDYIVEGTNADELINAGYGGDPEGDRVDSNDNLTNDNDDVIEAYGGNDTIGAGAGNDSVDAGTGDDQVFAETGNDTVLGGDGNDSVLGEAGHDSLIGDAGNDTLLGGDGNDTLQGGADEDSLRGEAGNDTIQGGDGNDYAHGGEGDDSIEGGAGDDELHGWFGNDTMRGGDGNDYLDADLGEDEVFGDAGNDTIRGGFSIESDTLHGGTGEDDIDGQDGDDIIYGDEGNDTLVGNFGNDTVFGGDGRDSILGGGGADELQGNAGNDTISGGDGADRIFGFGDDDSLLGDGGNDTINAGDGNDVVDGGANNDLIFGDSGDDTLLGNTGDDEIQGGIGNDSIQGGAGNDTLLGQTGNDTLNGGDGADALNGGAGDDSLLGGSRDDTLTGGTGDDVMLGEDGDDLFVLEDGFGNDTITGGESGEIVGDTLDLSSATGVTVDLTSVDPEAGTVSDGTATASFSEIENIILSSGNDTIMLADGSGNDTVQGFTAPIDNGDGTFTGSDTLDVTGLTDDGGAIVNTDDVTVGDDGSGNAVLSFPNGDSITLVGVAPAELSSPAALEAIGIPIPNYIVEGTNAGELIDANYTGDPEGDRVDANDNPTRPDDNIDVIHAGAGNDTVYAGLGNDTINGENGDDSLFGEDGHDTIQAGSGDDTAYGGDGNDLIFGISGNDSILGEAGADRLNDGSGNDTVEGGADADTFIRQEGWGVDTYIGGETGIDDDTLRATSISSDSTLDLTAGGTAADPESGTLTSGGGADVVTFSEIENFELGSGDDSVIGSDGDDNVSTGTGADTVDGGAGNDTFDVGSADGVVDTIVLEDGDGDDTVASFEGPIDNGDGTYTGQDQLDVSGLNDLGGDPVQVTDVTVTDDGSGNAVLTFPGGESITLTGIAPADVTDHAALEAMGIPNGLNYIVEGTAGNDTIDAGYTGDPEGDMVDNFDSQTNSNDDSIDAGAGDDIITAGDGNDTVQADAGNDLIQGGSGEDSIFGSAGSDTIDGDADDDTLDGGTGDDTISGGLGNDSIIGGDGNDQIFSENGQDTVDAGAGNDTVHASIGNDLIYGGAGDDSIQGGGFSFESDTIFGEAGNDVIDGGAGGDSVDGGTGNDTITARQDDTLTGGDGDDLFILTDPVGEPGAGTISIVGGEGDETDGDTLQLTSEISLADITFTNLDDNAGGLSGNFTMSDGTVVTFDEIENIICFTPGANILTNQGERAVETLAVGDMVVTRDHGLRPIRWIGKRTVRGHGDFAPVSVNSTVVGGGRKPLLVSPQHRILFTGYRAELLFGESEVLVPAKHLIDGRDVIQHAQDEVTYIHIMFDRHEVIYAEGIAAESFYAGDIALGAVEEAAREELFVIFPELRSAGGHHRETARTCLKRHEAALLVHAMQSDG